MKCSKHTDRDAVGQCANCGAGVCSECAKATEPLKESCGLLCANCYYSELDDTVAFYKKKRGKRIRKIIISTVLYIIGAVLLALGAAESSGEGISFIIIGVLLCGVFTGISWKKSAQESHEEYERKHGASYTVTDSGVYRDTGFGMKLLFFVIGTVFGVVLTPLKLIGDIIGSVQDTKTMKLMKEEMKEIQAL